MHLGFEAFPYTERQFAVVFVVYKFYNIRRVSEQKNLCLYNYKYLTRCS